MGTADRVLTVYDRAKQSVAGAFIAAAQDLGAAVNRYEMNENDRPLTDVPGRLAEILGDHTVLLTCFAARNAEIPFRVRLCLLVDGNARLRLIHCPGITLEMMRKGAMAVDYGEMKRVAQRLMARFDHAASIRLVTPAGTDLRLDVRGRAFKTDVEITSESPGNLPCGEIYCAPVEDGAEGVAVIDGSIGNLGVLSETVRLRIRKGRVIAVSCGNPRTVKRLDALLDVDSQARVIGELGIGLNPGARVTGNMLEDEKAGGTVHVAFGNNEEMPGGRNRSQVHRDMLMQQVTVVMEDRHGSRRTVMRNGILIPGR